MTQPAVIALHADDCWRRIGVSGDRSCAALAGHVHCRNCPTFAEAAQRNLQRPVEPEYRAAWARELARPLAPQAVADAAAMVFRVGAEWLAAPVAMVASVAPLAPVHRLPHRSGGGLLGIVNVGGRLLPAVSLAALLGIALEDAPAPSGRHAFARLLVLAADGQPYALPVDEVHGVLRYAGAAVRAPAATVEHAPSPLLAGLVRCDTPGGRPDAALSYAALLDGARLSARLTGLLR